MAIPTKKIYGRNGKLIFDPSNPEDVRSYKEKQSLMEALKLVQGLVDPRGGAGLTGMTRVISKVFGAKGAKAAKALFKKNKAKQITDLVTKPMTRGKKAVPKATPTVKEVVETKPTIPTNTPSTFKSPFANTSLRPYINTKGNPFDFNKFKLDGDVINKPLANVIEGAALVGKGAMVTGGLGVGSALFSSENRISSPIDLKRIDKSKLKDSNIEGVKTIRGSDGKDYGIKWNNTTKSWDYYRGGGKPVVKQTNPKQEKSGLAIGGGDGGGGTKENNSSRTGGSSNQRTTTGGGTGTKPRSATGQAFDKAFAEARKQAGGAGGIFEFNNKKYGTALEGETVPKNRVEVGKTTAPIMGDEEYKKDPRLAILRQEDDDRQLLARTEAQKKEMKEFKPTEPLDVLPIPTKPLSSLMFKTSTLNPKTGSRVEPVSYDTIDIVDTKSKKLRKKSYGGNLAMLKYMKQ